MSNYKFTPAERAAIYSIHGERCYLCEQPINLKTMEVDHILPESLLAKPEELKAALDAFDLPQSFDINSYGNWLPACRACNRAKKDRIFNPTPIIQICLQQSLAKAAVAQQLAEETLSQRKIANALNVLERAHDDGKLDEEVIQILAEFLSRQRAIDMVDRPLLLSPIYEVLSDQNGIQIIKGPYGVGARPAMQDAHISFSCPVCGAGAAWNGARCVLCGEMSD